MTTLATRKEAGLNAFRYRKEPWLLDEFPRISRFGNILEIGCGQGTDAIEICRRLKPGSRYRAIDVSAASIDSARLAAAEANPAIHPSFQKASARFLPFSAATFDAAYSMGVPHHIDDTESAISEMHRVLQGGGRAFVALYNSRSLKPIAARLLRSVQSACDGITGRSETFLPLARRISGRHLGTALIECFGVPVLKAYDEQQMRALFRDFEIERLYECGPFKSFWMIEAVKIA